MILEPAIKDPDEYGIDVQILSLTVAGVEFMPAAEGVMWAKKVNDYLVSLSEK